MSSKRKSKVPVLRATHVSTFNPDALAKFVRGDNSNLSCTICGSKGVGTCDCWTKCSCGWLYEKGTACRNPNCSK